MKKHLHTLAALSAIFLIGCTAMPEIDKISDDDIENNGLSTRAGEASTENPYSLRNVQQAYEDIAIEDNAAAPPVLQATHHYVRFLPKDSIEMYTLADNTRLELFTFPLDRILSDEEVEFYSNSIERIDGFGWQYTVVPVDFSYPAGIQYEFLDELYMRSYAAQADSRELIRLDSISVGIGKIIEPVAIQMTEELWDRVIYKSYQKTGIIPLIEEPLSEEPVDDDSPLSVFLSPSAWYPSAKITYTDEVTGETIPLEGLKVRVSTFTNSTSAYTNASGEVSGLVGWGGRFRYGVRYEIIFENHASSPRWNIRNGTYGQATIEGPKLTSRWVYNIDGVSDTNRGRKESAFAVVHMGMWYYSRVQRDIANCGRAVKIMHIGVKWDKESDNKNGRFFPWVSGDLGLVDHIVVYGKSDGNFRSRGNIIATLLHELGHASHWQATIDRSGLPTNFILVSDRMRESYANACLYALLQGLYPEHFYPIILGRTYDETYTGIGEALMNQGATISRLEDAVVASNTWDKWNENVKKYCSSIDDVVVDMLFDNAELIWDRNLRFCLDGQEIAYPNTVTRYELNPRIFNNGVTVTDWILPEECTEVDRADDDRWIEVTFATLGSKHIEANLLFPDGETPYTTSIDPEVKTISQLSGNTTIRIGDYSPYTLSNNSRAVTWQIWRSDNTPFENVTTEAGLFRRVSSSNTNMALVFFRPGTYRIRAMVGNAEIARIETNVPAESTGAEITRIFSYKENASTIVDSRYGSAKLGYYQNVYHQYDMLDPLPIASAATTVNLGTNAEFMLFDDRLASDSPNYSALRAVYECRMTGRGKVPCIVTNYKVTTPECGNISGSDHTIIGYIYSGSKLGTIPIYRIKEDGFTDETKDYEHYYLTAQNMASKRAVTSWVWNWLGTRKVRDKNWTEVHNLGIVGYAYPAN